MDGSMKRPILRALLDGMTETSRSPWNQKYIIWGAAVDSDSFCRFKMTRELSFAKICHCTSCRVWNTKALSKKRAVHKAYLNDEICTARTNPLSPASSGLDDRWDDSSSSDNDSLAGITYSYDRTTGPRAGTDTLSYAVTEAVKKFENKELATLIKNEYEVVDSEDSDEEFELI